MTTVSVGSLVEGTFGRGLPAVKGTVLSYEMKTDFAPGGLTLIENHQQKKGDVLLVTNDLLNAVRITPSPPSQDNQIDQEPTTLAAAREREAETIKNWIPLGTYMTKEAQQLFDKFYKQLPKDTRWYDDGNSQDILVLGVLVRHPFQGDCCEAVDATGQKSLKRIKDMVANFSR